MGISPWWIYLIQVIGGLKVAAAFALILAAGVAIYLFDEAGLEKAFRASVILTIVFAGMCLLIPTRETLITIKIMEFATPETGQEVLDAIRYATEYILESLK